MTDLHGEVARLKLLLSEAKERAARLERLRLIGLEMRATQTEYFTYRDDKVKRRAMRLEKQWDRLAAEADPVAGKPVILDVQGDLFPRS